VLYQDMGMKLLEAVEGKVKKIKVYKQLGILLQWH
jgi:hypothetical protein